MPILDHVRCGRQSSDPRLAIGGRSRRAVKLWSWRRALRDHGPSHPGLLLTLYTIGTWMDADGFCFPSQHEIAKGARCSTRTVKRHISQARALGWLHTEPGPMGGRGWRLTAYHACIPESVQLGGRDEELTDHLHAESGDVGDQYAGGGDIIVSPPADSATHEVVTSETDVGTPVSEGGDTGDTDVGTQWWPTNSSENSSKELNKTEGHAAACPRAGKVSGIAEGMPRVSDLITESTSDGRHARIDASPADIPESRRRRILELLGHGYDVSAVARMSGMQPETIAELVREAAA